MENILDALWDGNIRPYLDCYTPTKETNKLMQFMADHHGKLMELLSEDEKEIFQKFDDCNSELADIYSREIFAYAFRLGARVMIAALYPDCHL